MLKFIHDFVGRYERELEAMRLLPKFYMCPLFDAEESCGCMLLKRIVPAKDVWQNMPFVFLMLYAAMQTISADQYKAAKIDGAGTLAQLWYITIPIRTIDTFRIFDKVNLLTGGGPAGSTAAITQYIYNNGIKSLKFGIGSACAIIMTILVLILSSMYIKDVMNQKG